VLTKDSAGVI